MDSVLRTAEKVPGFTFLEVIDHDDNPTLHEEYSDKFLNGWHEIIIHNDGSNLFYPNEGFWRALIIWLATSQPIQLRSNTETSFVKLEAGDTITDITLSEEAIPANDHQTFGVWFNVWFIDHTGKKKRTAHLFDPLQKTHVAGLN